jgi:hypothetical protein
MQVVVRTELLLNNSVDVAVAVGRVRGGCRAHSRAYV